MVGTDDFNDFQNVFISIRHFKNAADFFYLLIDKKEGTKSRTVDIAQLGKIGDQRFHIIVQQGENPIRCCLGIGGIQVADKSQKTSRRIIFNLFDG